MKNIYKIKQFIVALVVVGFSFSCEGFLDETNYSSQTADQLFATEDGYESLVNGMYSNVRGFYNSKSHFNLSWLGTDLITQNLTTSTSPLNQYTGFTKDNGDVNSVWASAYSALKACNAVIDRGAKADISDELRTQRVAEGKGLRALFLFELVRNWGDVPLMTYEVSEITYESQRDPASEVYAQILEDLSEAIEVLPATQSANNYGRFSSSAAKHLRSLVYLTRGYQSYAESTDFANAYKDASELIAAGDHSLLPDYGLVHRQDNEINDEIIFAAQWSKDATVGTGNAMYTYLSFNYSVGYLGGATNNYYANVDHAFVPTKFAYMVFDWAKDARARTTFMSSYNGDPATSTDGRENGKNWIQAVGEVTDTFELGDATLLFPTPAYSATAPAEKIKEKTLTLNYPTGDPCDYNPNTAGENDYWKLSAEFPEGDRTNTSATSRTFLPVWKFKDANVVYGSTVGTRDTYLFRLAETYLIAAEAALQNNDQENALKYLNDVRERAEINAGDLVYPAGTTVDIDMILDERALELLGENSRWNDLQRTGKLAERTLKYNWDVNNITGGIPSDLTASETKFNLRPIPLTWINSLSNSTEIENNPGW